MRTTRTKIPNDLLAALAAACLAAWGCAGAAKPPGQEGFIPIDMNRPGDPLFAEGLAAYDDAHAAELAGFTLKRAGDLAGANAKFEYAAAQYAAAQAIFDSLPIQFPQSIRLDQAAYLAGRCSYEIATLTADATAAAALYADARARLDAMETAYPASMFLSDAAYFDGRARFHLGEYAGARAQFEKSLATNARGTFAAAAQYYLGRCWFAVGLQDKAAIPTTPPPLPDPMPAEFTVAKNDFRQAEQAFLNVKTTYGSSSWVDDATYHRGRSFFEDPTDERASNAERVSNLNAALAELRQVVAMTGTSLVPSAQFWQGRCHYALAFQLASGGVLDQGHVTEALSHLKAVPPPSVYADNSLYYVAKCYVQRDPGPICLDPAVNADSAPASACSAYTELTALVAGDAAYAGSPYPASTETYIQPYCGTCPQHGA